MKMLFPPSVVDPLPVLPFFFYSVLVSSKVPYFVSNSEPKALVCFLGINV